MTRLTTLAAALGGFLGGIALATGEAARKAERARPAPGRFMRVGGLRLHYIDRPAREDRGPPVVLLHGNGMMAEDFLISGLVDRLARHRRVVVIDRPGFGRSNRPRGLGTTPEAQAAVIAAAIGRLGLGRPIVAGHSFGSMVAMALALDHPEKVGGLALLGGYFFPTARADVVMMSPSALPLLGDVLRYTAGPPLGRALSGRMIAALFAPLPVPARFALEFPVPLCLRPWQIRALAEDSAAMVPAAMRQSRRHHELRMPVAIIAGEADEVVTTARQSARLHREMPGSRLTVVPGAGHMVHHATPEVVAEEIEALGPG
jgi:pimeloyl-ACP methyl ester carboxylesterase